MKEVSAATHRPRLNGLSDEQVKAIHQATLRILSEVGIVMKSKRGRDLLLEGGAVESGGRIKIPPHVLYDALSSAPERFSLYGRSGELAMPMELGRVFYGPGSDTPNTLDLETGERRRATKSDVRDFGRLADALDNIDYAMTMGVPRDVTIGDEFVHGFIEMLRGCTKPLVYTAGNMADIEDIHRIATAVAGGEQAFRQRPFLLHYAEPISPLLFPAEAVDQVIFCAQQGIPLCFPPSPNTGGGGPITMAGALALGSAECLVGLILTQLVQKGAPFLYGMNLAVMDMKTMVIAYGSPEWSLGMAADVDLAEFYNLPVWGVGGSTDAKIIDAQAGLEACMSIYSALQCRCTLVHDVGYIESGLTSSMEMLVMGDEIIRMARFVIDGIEVSKDTLALDAIARVNPGSGFLADDHTFDHWRTAQWTPSLLDRRQYEDWEADGSRDLYARLNDRAREILSEHQVPPLSDEVEEIIADVLAQRQATAEADS
jgi:trimethylamine---corrinoid protein Co-methyltransferase